MAVKRVPAVFVAADGIDVTFVAGARAVLVGAAQVNISHQLIAAEIDAVRWRAAIWGHPSSARRL